MEALNYNTHKFLLQKSRTSKMKSFHIHTCFHLSLNLFL